MSDSQHKVTFQPQGRAVSVPEGTTILEAVVIAGLVIDTPCGGAGTCDKCQVQILQGEREPSDADRKTFTKAELESGWRLACQNPVEADVVAHVPMGSLVGGNLQIARDSSVSGSAEVQPTFRRVHVERPAPPLEDARPDLLRLEERPAELSVNGDFQAAFAEAMIFPNERTET